MMSGHVALLWLALIVPTSLVGDAPANASGVDDRAASVGVEELRVIIPQGPVLVAPSRSSRSSRSGGLAADEIAAAMETETESEEDSEESGHSRIAALTPIPWTAPGPLPAAARPRPRPLGLSLRPTTCLRC